jgi:hypothetical protein
MAKARMARKRDGAFLFLIGHGHGRASYQYVIATIVATTASVITDPKRA